MSFTQTALQNGATVVLAPFSGTDAAAILVLFQVGSRFEDSKVWGGSHFVEHVMFKGTERRPQTVDISKELDRYGAQFNAYTGKDLTGYWVKIAAEQLPVAIDLLHDMTFHSKFDGEEMEREKQVIIEEIKMYEENPMMHIEDLLEEAMFDGHVLGRNIAGTSATMKAMQRGDVIAYHSAHYRPENMVIVASGKLPDDFIGQLEKTFGVVPSSGVLRSKFDHIENDVLQGRVRFQKKEVEQVQLALGFPTIERGHADEPALKLLSAILGGTMSSRLFVEVRERRGLCYSVQTGTEAYQDTGMFTVRAGLDVNRLAEAMQVICNELRKVAVHGVTSEELEMVKDHVRGGLLLNLEDSASRAEYYGRQALFLDVIQEPDERLKKFDAVTLSDIARVANQYLVFGRMSLAAIGPFASEDELKRLIPLN
ncbi:MAG: pitrilysin family protein [Patescibacteria group bacterium]|jgi:predicted Zn-dependent peptidase